MKKKLIIAMIISVIAAGAISVGAFAAGTLTEVKAYLNQGIKITLDGSAWTPKDTEGNKLSPITYNGSTYLPVRAVGEAAGVNVGWDPGTQTVILGDTYDAVLQFPANKYPQTAAHIASAILAGESAICTIDRAGADANRDDSLAGIPTKDGYDRDEWPMAMCEEGGAGADIAYITPDDNRGAGSWVGNALVSYKDGTRVKFVVTFGELDADAVKKQPQGETSSATPVPCTKPEIKGNISSSGEKIYHSPGGAFYDRTDAEQMFCSSADAEAAGFRASSR